MERIAVFPGSFDPVTVGHEDLIRRSAALFDRVIVLVAHNPAKRGCFSVEERTALLRRVTAQLPQVEVDQWDGLLADYVRRMGACTVVRGVRGPQDFTAEMTMAQVNARLLPGMETIFLTTKPEHGCISSSIVREAASFGGDISAMVPACIVQDVLARFANR